MRFKTRAELERFEELAKREYADYLKENEQKPLHQNFVLYPVRNLLLVALLIASALTATDIVRHESPSPVHSVVAVVMGIYLADFVTGLLHLWADTIPLSAVSVRERSLKEWIAFGFHYHHANTANWNENDIYFAAILRAGLLFYVPVAGPAVALSRYLPPLATLGLLAMGNFGLITQLSHAAAHGRWNSSPSINRLVRFLQRAGILLPPEMHRAHHTGFDGNFAILTGWSTPLLNLIYDRWFRAGLDEGVAPETQRRVYATAKGRREAHLLPYLVIFPEWREANARLRGDPSSVSPSREEERPRDNAAREAWGEAIGRESLLHQANTKERRASRGRKERVRSR